MLKRCLVFGLLSGFAGAGLAQSTSGDGTAPITTLQADTRAVLVDVVVTKGNGEPVTGLTKSDFAVAEDGKVQTVLSFDEHVPRGVKAVTLPAMPPDVFTNVPSAPAADALTVILLDGLNTPQQDQSYVRDQILAFLKATPGDAPVALFTLGDRLRLVLGFNGSRADLIAAIEDKKTGVGPQKTYVSRSPQDALDEQEHIAKMQMMLGGFGRSTAGVASARFSEEEMKGFNRELKTEMTVEALQNLARYLAKIAGRKNLIWFATEFPLQFFPSMNSKGMYDLGVLNNGMKQVADLLTVSRVAIYPVGAHGMDTRNWMEGDNAGSGGRPSAGGALMGDLKQGDAESEANTSVMTELAQETGGEMIHNTNDMVGAMRRAIDNGTHYYTLSYSPTNAKMDGQLRSIQLKMTSGRYKLSYRHGYYAFDDATPRPKQDSVAVARAALAVAREETTASALKLAPPALLPLLQHGSPSSTQILYGLRVARSPAQPAAGAKLAGANGKLTGPVTRYTLDFMIRWTDVRLTKAADGSRTGQIDVQMIAYDADGKALNWTGSSMGMHLTPSLFEAIERSGIPAHLEIDVPANAASFATGVYDWNSGKAGTLEVERGKVVAVSAAGAGQ